MNNEIQFFSTNQKDAFLSLANKIIDNYNSLGGNLKKFDSYRCLPSESSLLQMLNKVSIIIFDRGEPLSVPHFLKRIATGKIKGLGKPDGDAFARLEDTFLGMGHFRNGEAYTLTDNELKALRMYLQGTNVDRAVTEFKYKELIITSVLHNVGVKFANSKNDSMLHNQFKVSITNQKTNIKTQFDFYGSYNDYKNGVLELKDLELLNAFECFINDSIAASEDFEEFCNSLGYDSDSRAAHKVYKECVKSLEKAEKIISGDLYEFYNELQKTINN